MEKITYSQNQFVLYDNCTDYPSSFLTIKSFFDFYNILFSNPDKNLKILLKANFNNDINGIMSNSTDLRIIAAVANVLKEKGYHDITIADGPNGGTVRRNVNVFSRLRIDRLAESLGIKYLDLNNDLSLPAELTNNEPVEISKTILGADILINLPKIKTHWEAGLSLATKNLMGCLTKFSKKKMHYNFLPNLLRLNELIKPRLHIVDGLIAMEGQGPGDGRPKKLGFIFAGTNNYLVDLTIARLMGFSIDEIGYLKLAAEYNLISSVDLETARRIMPIASLLKSHQPLVTKIATARWLTSLRSLLRPVFQSPKINNYLIRHKIMQDAYVDEDDRIENLALNDYICDKCGKCKNLCPMGLDPVKDAGGENCIQCLYCALACPKNAIKIEGNLGFLDSQIKRYGESLKKL